MESKANIHVLAPQPDIDKLDSAERLFHDRNIIRWEGYYFCFDPKAAAKRTGSHEFVQSIKTPSGKVEHSLVVEPNEKYGYPSILAYKVLQAILKKLTDYGYPVQSAVSFTQRELSSLAQRKSWGGRDGKELLQAVKQLRRTTITATIYNKETDEWVTESFEILIRDIFSGRKNNINQCVVYLNPTIVDSLNNRYTFCINYTRLSQLEAIGVALYKQLYFKFGYLHSAKKLRDKTFIKDYATICNEWLGGLKVLSFKSKIEKEQLGKHLDQLKKVKLIRSYKIEKNSKGDGFNIIFVVGSGFYHDYEHFYKRALQPGLPFERANDEHEVQHPLELVRYFHEKKHGAHHMRDIVVSEKERGHAKTLLETYSFTECKALVDYALQEAAITKFDMKQFGAVKLYRAGFEGSRERRERYKKQKAAAQARAEQEALKDRYDEYRQNEFRRIRAELPRDELAAIEDPIREGLCAEKGRAVGFEGLVRVQVNKIIEERFAILTYEEWISDKR